jgi:hypothetical protein
MKIGYFGVDLTSSGQSVGNFGSIVNSGGSNAPTGYILVKQPNDNNVLQPNGLNIFAPLK